MTKAEYDAKCNDVLAEMFNEKNDFRKQVEAFARKLNKTDEKLRMLIYEVGKSECSDELVILANQLQYELGKLQAVRSNVNLINNLVNPF